jgi:hypothetical protein
MEVRKSYIFFLIITTFGALCTLKICATAYSAFDYSAPVSVHDTYARAKLHNALADPNS